MIWQHAETKDFNRCMNMLYLTDKVTIPYAKHSDPYICKNIEELYNRHADKFAPYGNWVRYETRERWERWRNFKNYKQNIHTLSNGLLDSDFPWDLFYLTGSAIFGSLTEQISKVGDLDIMYHKSTVTPEELLKIVQTEIIDKRLSKYHDDIQVYIPEGKKRVRIEHPNIKPMDVYCNQVSDVARYHSDPTNGYYDGKNMCLFPRFIHCLFTGNMSMITPMKTTMRAEMRKKYVEKFGLAILDHAQTTCEYTLKLPIQTMLKYNPLCNMFSIIGNSIGNYDPKYRVAYTEIQKEEPKPAPKPAPKVVPKRAQLP
jgi:hypothetical protein